MEHPEGRRPGDIVHRPLCRPRLGSGDRQAPARRRRLRRPAAKPQAGAAGDPDRRQRRVFVQGLRLCPRRHLRPLRDVAGRQQHPLPRPHASRGSAISRRRARRRSATSICSACPKAARLILTQPWRLQLLAQRAFGARDKAFLTFDVGYELPQGYLKPVPAPAAAAAAAAPSDAAAPEPSEPPMWHMMWRAKTGEIGVLLGAIGLLTLIFFFQDWLVRRPVFYDRLRLGFHGVHAGLDRLVRAGAIVGRQRARLPQRPADGFPLGLFPDGAADLHPVVRDRGLAAVLEPRRLLRLAVSVRRLAGADQPPRQASQRFRSSRFPSASISA